MRAHTTYTPVCDGHSLMALAGHGNSSVTLSLLLEGPPSHRLRPDEHVRNRTRMRTRADEPMTAG